MCNIAGYVGSRHAAPILLDMIEAQEGLAGGYYTGIATIHDGQLHYEKVVGDTQQLRNTSSAADLPGTIGIAHSRSKSGGDREWGQPFVNCDRTVAYLANGSMGYWQGKTDTSALAAQLYEADHHFLAVSDEPIGSYPVLPDGRGVHTSELMCHAISAELTAGAGPMAAIASAFTSWPAEIVGLYLAAQHPDAIFAARWNMPVCMGRTSDGSYLASAPLALPAEANWRMWVPPCSVARVSAAEVELATMGLPEQALAADIEPGQAREAILEALQSSDGKSIGELNAVVGPLSSRDDRRLTYQTVYQLLSDLESERLVSHRIDRVEGAEPHLTAPRFRFIMVG